MAITSPSAWSAKHILAAILPFLVILAISAVSLRAQPSGTSADPDFVHALDIVKVDRVVKLNAADGTSLFEITDAPGTAPGRCGRTPWRLLGVRTLLAYGFDSQFHLSLWSDSKQLAHVNQRVPFISPYLTVREVR